jgi:hypothetical protein
MSPPTGWQLSQLYRTQHNRTHADSVTHSAPSTASKKHKLHIAAITLQSVLQSRVCVCMCTNLQGAEQDGTPSALSRSVAWGGGSFIAGHSAFGRHGAYGSGAARSPASSRISLDRQPSGTQGNAVVYSCFASSSQLEAGELD